MDNSQRIRTTTRQIGINVAGNLVTAAILYLLALWAGYVVVNKVALGLSVFLVGTAFWYGSIIAGLWRLSMKATFAIAIPYILILSLVSVLIAEGKLH